MPELKNILLLLSEANFKFVLVGGYAAAAHGSSMVTEDVDVCAEFSTENIMRLNTALAGLNPVHRMTPQKIKLELTPKFCEGLNNLYLDTDIGQLDILSSITAVGTYPDAVRESIVVNMNGMNLHILNLDALIRSKEALTRPRDKESVIILRSIKETQK